MTYQQATQLIEWLAE